MRQDVLDAYGVFVAGLAPWRWFLTLTYDPRDLAASSSTWTRVGRQRADGMLSRWMRDSVRKACPDAQAWVETELHVTGQPHHHGVLALPESAPWLRMRTEWWEANGWARFDPIDESRGAVARYVCKYAAKASAGAPFTVGLSRDVTYVAGRGLYAVNVRDDERERRWFYDPAGLVE